MRLLRRFLARVKNFATGRQDDQRLREEMEEEHLARQMEENLRAGKGPAEARRQAVLKFGLSPGRLPALRTAKVNRMIALRKP
jgi:hypothetical protein